MENIQAVPEKSPAAPKTWSFTCAFSWDGPGLPARGEIVEFCRGLSRRDIAIAAGAVFFIFVLEPLILFWLLSVRLNRRIDANATSVTAAVSGRIITELGPGLKEILCPQQQRVITPLNAADPMALVLPSAPTPPGKTQP